jgi:hypothetical protein
MSERKASEMNIKEVVDDQEWQRLRKSLQHTWTSNENVNDNLNKFDNYLKNGSGRMDLKLRRVHNYLGALRGQDKRYPQIKRRREEIKARRKLL